MCDNTYKYYVQILSFKSKNYDPIPLSTYFMNVYNYIPERIYTCLDAFVCIYIVCTLIIHFYKTKKVKFNFVMYQNNFEDNTTSKLTTRGQLNLFINKTAVHK